MKTTILKAFTILFTGLLLCIITYSTLEGIRFNALWMTSIFILQGVICFLIYRSYKVKIDNANLIKSVLNTIDVPIWHDGSDELYSQSAKDINHHLASQNLSLKKVFSEINSGENLRRFLILNGSRKLFEAVSKQSPDLGFPIHYCTDKTTEFELSNKLKHTIDANNQVMELFSSGISIFDHNMKLIFYNAAYKKITGLKDEEIKNGQSFSAILDLLRRNRKLPELIDFLEYKNEQIALFRTITAPIQDFIYLPNSSIIRKVTAPYSSGGLIVIFEDITDKMNLEQQYNGLLAVQKETIEHLYEGIMVFGIDNRLHIINKAAKEIWNLENTNVGIHLSKIVHDVIQVIEFFTEEEEFKSGLVSNLTDRIKKQGRLALKNGRIIQFSYIPLPDGAHLHSYIDITDSYKVEAAFFEKNQALETVVQMKNDFITRASAELLEPLNMITGFTQLLKNQYYGSLNEKQMSHLDGISHGSKNLMSLANNIISLSSLQSGHVTPTYSVFSIKEMLKDIITSTQKQALEKTINFKIINNLENITIKADEMLLKQAFIVLLNKTIKSSQQDSNIELSLSNDDKNFSFIIVCPSDILGRNSQEKVLYRTEEGLDKCMYNFTSVSLPLFNHIIKLHNGLLRIEYDGDKNTTISAEIPLS